MNKTKTVVLLEADRVSMVDNWTDSLTVSRNARKRFTVELSKYGEDSEGGGSQRWRTWDKTVDLSTPTQVLNAIESIVNDQHISLDWAKTTALIAELDWLTAAVIADKMNVRLPAPPEADELANQRSLRTLGKVTIGVEWGDDLHEVTLSMTHWVEIISGWGYDTRTSYYYEGARFTANWGFSMDNDQPYLEVSYYGKDDDGGTGWRGKLRSGHLYDGKCVDGIDVAKLLLRAVIQNNKH
jgi:hypothetical protein